MELHGACGNCKTPFQEESAIVTTILSTWSKDKTAASSENVVGGGSAPDVVSIIEALSVVFEIPPLTPNEDQSCPGSPPTLSKRDVFKNGSKFSEGLLQGNENEGRGAGGGFGLCFSCSEMLTVLYNSFQDFTTTACILESEVGKVLKELELEATSSRAFQDGTLINHSRKTNNDETKTCREQEKDNNNEAPSTTTRTKQRPSDRANNKGPNQHVIVKTEPIESDDDDSEQAHHHHQNEPTLAALSPESSMISVSTDLKRQQNISDDNGEDVIDGPASPTSPVSPGSDDNNEKKISHSVTVNEIHSCNDERPIKVEVQRRILPKRNAKTRKFREYMENSASEPDDEERKNPKRSKIKNARSGEYSDSEEDYVPPTSNLFSSNHPRFINNPSRLSSQANRKFGIFMKHQSKLSEIKQLTCQTCGKKFLLRNTWICHRRIVHRENIPLTPVNFQKPLLPVSKAIGGKTSTCPLCRTLIPRGEIRAHLSSHTRSLARPWLCRICGRDCSSQSNLYDHLKNHELGVLCKRCGRRVPRLEFLKHTKACFSQSKDGKFACKVCKHTFTSSMQLVEHRSRVHGHYWKCKLCGSKFSRRAKMVEHMVIHRKKRTYKCKICDKTYDRIDVLRLHVKRFHRKEGPPSALKDSALETGDAENETSDTPHKEPPEPITPIYDERYLCKSCENVRFSTFGQLEKHLMETHTVDLNCSICKRQFQDKYCLTLHIKIHSEIKPYSCHICFQTYKEKNAFFYHIMDTHNIETRVIILTYPGVFTVRKDPRRPYKRGKRIFKKPPEKGKYPCEICGKIFPYQQSVKTHIKVVHDQIKEFICSYCGKGFARKSYFLVHERLHVSTETPYKCHLCGKGFRLPGNLRAHLLSTIHNSKRDFVCDVCGKGFNRMDNLRLHVKAVHMKIQVRKPRDRHTPSSSGRRKLSDVDNLDDKYVPNVPIISGTSQSFLHEEQPSNVNTILPQTRFELDSGDSIPKDHCTDSREHYESLQQHRAQLATLSMPVIHNPSPSTSTSSNFSEVATSDSNLYSQTDFNAAQSTNLSLAFRSFHHR